MIFEVGTVYEVIGWIPVYPRKQSKYGARAEYQFNPGDFVLVLDNLCEHANQCQLMWDLTNGYVGYVVNPTADCLHPLRFR